MTDVEPTLDEAPAAEPGKRNLMQLLADLPRWKKILMGVAATFVVLGIVAIPFSGSDDLSTGGGGNVPEGVGTSFAPGGGTGPDGTQGEPKSNLSPALLKLGFSFFVGFALGFAFRTFVMLALIFLGFMLMALFGLEYATWITVNWETMGGSFDGFVSGAKDEASSFQSFITGRLPQAGLATLGIVTGFKR